MDRKIELIQEEKGGKNWHWVILEYDRSAKAWHNISSGLEESYEKASVVAKKEYDLL